MTILPEFLATSGCEANLSRLLGEVIPSAVKRIAQAIQNADSGFAGSKNASGEAQLALDIQANQIILDVLQSSGLVLHAASEEIPDLVSFSSGALRGFPQFTVVFDPLDGSSLADVNFAVGSIFGVYEGVSPIGRTGADMLASCYAVYGPNVTIVLTHKRGTHEFKFNNKDGNFYLTRGNLAVSAVAKHFAPGNLRAASERADYLQLTCAYIKRGLTLRYSGGMVPDINHILLKGNGIFTYPGYSKAKSGKLRLLFECNPISLLVEQAGGESLDGGKRILEKKITELHQRTPIFCGSKEEVEQACKALAD